MSCKRSPLYHHHHHHYHHPPHHFDAFSSILLTDLFSLQLFVVDLVDIGLLNLTEATGRRRLNQSISQLSDVIPQGLTGTVGNFRFGVTSLRQCVSGNGINNGCSNGTVVAKGPPLYVTDIPSSTRKFVVSPSSAGNIVVSKCVIYWLLAVVAFYV